MKKNILFILLIFVSTSFAQNQISTQEKKNFHLIYVRIDVETDTPELIDSLRSYLRRIENDDFVVYLSNVREIYVKKKFDESDLLGTIYEQNSFASLPNAISEIDYLIDYLSEILEKNLDCKQIDSLYYTDKYERVKLICFVDEEFIANKMDRDFIAKYLFINQDLRRQEDGDTSHLLFNIKDVETRPDPGLVKKFDWHENLYKLK